VGLVVQTHELSSRRNDEPADDDGLTAGLGAGAPGVYETRVWWAMMLAKDIETCEALLRGGPVDPARLDPEWLRKAQQAQLVSLDVNALDLIHIKFPEEPA